MKLTLLVLFISLRISAAEKVQFESSWNLFSQKVSPSFSLPEDLSERIKLNVQFELPEADGTKLKKVFIQTSTVNEYKVTFEVYYFNQNTNRYFSQQIFLYKDEKLVTRCTSYFSIAQKYLVPGSCAGVKNDELIGIALYR